MAGYRLGIDIGVNSLGWCAFALDGEDRPAGILGVGTRLFTDGRDPKTGTSLAVDRRRARGLRRRRDRYLLRRADLVKALVRHGLMPDTAEARKELERLDPYELRARALDEEIPLHEFGRALFHLHQRRGFKSNRKTDKAADKDAGKIKVAVSELRARINETGTRTLGEYLFRFHKENAPIRARLRGEGAKAAYDMYPERAMLEAEFERLWESQSRFHRELTDAARDDVRRIMFRQRPLRPVDPGKCALDPSDQRAPWALPDAQRFRILQELANLRTLSPDFTERFLTVDQRDTLLAALEQKPKLTFKAMRRLLKVQTDGAFNLESERRDHLLGNETNVALAKKGRFGGRWRELPADKRDEIVETLLAEADEDRLLAIAQERWGLDAEAAQAVADAPLPDGYVRLGRRALSRVVPAMLSESVEVTDPGTGEVFRAPITYDRAAVVAGYHHSDHRPGELLSALPYYGEALERAVAFGTGDPADPDEVRYGRIANPTVHIGLNQLRRFVNSLIEAHGAPAEVVVELARELKLSAKRKKEIDKLQGDNTKANQQRKQKLTELGLPDNPQNLLRLRLWEELAPEPHDRRCVYTGAVIAPNLLFDGRTDIDHILPFAKTFDDSAANKIVCIAGANRDKGRRTPYEAFGHRADWPEIAARAESLPKNKRWRFAPDALDRLKLKARGDLPAEALADMELAGGFLARHLTDTQYLSRLVREYLGHVCRSERVWVVPGRLTALLRAKWGLNGILSDSNLKNRADHRHHAIDAAVVALTDRSTLQKVASAAEDSRNRVLERLDEPFAGFREELRNMVFASVVSLRPDHGTGGRLHEDTGYGIVADPGAEGGFTLVSRKAFSELNENEVARIRDPYLRARVVAHVDAAKAAGGGKLSKPDLKKALAEFAETDAEYGPRANGRRGIRRVRLGKVEADFLVMRDGDGRPYKALVPGENHHVDIWQLPDGTWQGVAVSVFEANRPNGGGDKRPHPAARRIMRLHKGDFLKLEHDGIERVMRVVRLEQKAGRLRLAEHHEAGNLQERHDDNEDPFRWAFVQFNHLRSRHARKVQVDMLGRVRDLGPPP